jgi:hypothetical protein
MQPYGDEGRSRRRQHPIGEAKAAIATYDVDASRTRAAAIVFRRSCDIVFGLVLGLETTARDPEGSTLTREGQALGCLPVYTFAGQFPRQSLRAGSA